MLHYITSGSPERPTVCFLHGFMGSAADWAPITQALSDDAHCLLVDLPGHGQSVGRPAHEYSMEGATQAVADVLDDAGVQDCTLVGYSMGGRVSLYFSIFHPDRVHRLVLESASPGLTSSVDRLARRELDAERARQIQADLPAFLQEWYRMPLFYSLSTYGLVESMIETRSQNDPDELARALVGLSVGAQPSLWERLGDLDIPLLMLAGALDTKYVQMVRHMALSLRRSETLIVPDAGHNIHAERPQAFIAHLVHFLSRS